MIKNWQTQGYETIKHTLEQIVHMKKLGFQQLFKTVH